MLDKRITAALVATLSLVATTAVTAAATVATAAVSGEALERRSLVQAQTIRAEVSARYRARPGPGLAVTEASSTGVVESFTLLAPDLLGARSLPADNGIWYAICPVRATCPYPARRFARAAAARDPRRLALELAVRTFLETSADVVGVSLPTPRFVAFIVERQELAREVDLPTLARALGGNPARAISRSLKNVVERLTRPRVYLFLSLEPTASGRESWAGLPRWPASPD
jgi:hypothetical protein